MRIQHNIPALNTYRQLGISNTGSAKSLEKLSSGFRINRAGDDAAGLAISEKMRAQVRGLNRASANAQDGISLIQAAEGALQEVHNILQRMRELSIQSANDTNQVEDRQAIQDEVNQLVKELDRISSTTEFNKKTVLDGSLQDGKYGKLISGFNMSSISLIAPADPSSAPLVNGMTSLSVAIAGEKMDLTYDFSLMPGLSGTDSTDSGAINGAVQELGTGILTVTLEAGLLKAAGLDSTSEEIKIAVSAGDTGNTIAGNVMDLLQKTLGSDFTLSVVGSKVNVQSKYVGYFMDGMSNEDGSETTSPITIEWEAVGGEDIFANDTGEWGEVGEGGLMGTVGKDAKIEVNADEVDLAEFNAAGLFADELSGGFVKGRDTMLQFFLGDAKQSNHEAQFSFKIDDATKASMAIIATMDGSNLSLQVGANAGYAQTLKIAVGSMSAKSLSVSEINVMSHKEAQNAIISVDAGLQIVSDTRAGLGAIQNRLEHTISNLDTVSENLADAESRIRDVDMAKEMMNFTKFNILLQASQAMLAQANSLPQGVLQLLR